MTCPQCGADNPGNNKFCMKCGAELPAAVEAGADAGQQPAAGGSSFGYNTPPAPSFNTPAFGSQTMPGMVWRQDQLAGVGTRFVSVIIDGIVLWVIDLVLSIIHLSALTSLASLIYFGYFWSTTGQTPGSMVMKIKVVRADGQPLSIATGVLRYIGYVISCVVVFIGLLWALWDPYKQGWHDKIASTVVIRA